MSLDSVCNHTFYFVHNHSYDYSPNWTQFSPITIATSLSGPWVVSLVFMRRSHAVLHVESGSSCSSVFAQILHQHMMKDVMATRKIIPCPELCEMSDYGV